MADRLSSATRRASEACRHGAITEDGRLPINSTALSRSPASRSITRPLIVRLVANRVLVKDETNDAR